MIVATFENVGVGDRIAKTKFPQKNWWVIYKKDESSEPCVKIRHSRGLDFKDDEILFPLHFRIYRWYKVCPRHLPPKADISKGEI